MATNPVPESQERWRVSQVFLGLVILWQVFFVVANSVLQFIQDGNELEDEEVVSVLSWLTLDLPNEKGPGQQVYQALVRWGEVTGQEQGWSLFAPGVTERGRFLQVHFHWDDGRPPVVFPSPNEPPDLAGYFRWGHWRLRKYETFLGVNYSVRDGETLEDARTRWRRLNQRKAWRQADYLPGYLLGRWRAYKDEHPACPTPAQIQLHVVCWEIPPADRDPWFWQGPIHMPFARLRLNPDGSRNGTVQPYNPLSKLFDDLQ